MAGTGLRRPTRPAQLISLVPMIDVMLIMLVFFMVTSTYLNLDMIPAVHQQDSPAQAAAPSDAGGTLMIRLGSDGIPVVQGAAVPAGVLSALLAGRLADDPLLQVLVLPSGGATTQALISVMDEAARAGAVRLRVVRLEARP